MSDLALTALKVIFLIVLYLFIARAVRVIWLDLAGPRVPKRGRAKAKTAPAATRSAAATAAPTKKQGRRGAAAPSGAGRGSGRGSGAKSLLVSDEGGAARTYALTTGQPVTLGRSSDCTVPLNDTYVSQMHTRFFQKDDVWHVEDLGSTNGTLLNRLKVSDPMPVAPGDQVRLGKTTVEVRGA